MKKLTRAIGIPECFQHEPGKGPYVYFLSQIADYRAIRKFMTEVVVRGELPMSPKNKWVDSPFGRIHFEGDASWIDVRWIERKVRRPA